MTGGPAPFVKDGRPFPSVKGGRVFALYRGAWLSITWPKGRAASGPAKGRRDFLTYKVIVVDLLQGVACLPLWRLGPPLAGTLSRALLDGVFHPFKADKLAHY